MSNTTNGNETRVAVRQAGPMALQTLEDLARFGQVLYESGLFPDVKSQAQAVVKILAGQEIGLPVMEAMMKIDIVQGKIRFSADLMARIIKRDANVGGYDYRVVRLDNDACVLQFYHQGNPLDPPSSYTMADAAKAKLAGKPTYQEHPRNMLFARALTNGAKWHCPHLFGPAASVGEVSTDLEEDGEVVMSAPTPPTEQQVVTEAARNTAALTVPRAASPRFHVRPAAIAERVHVPTEMAEAEEPAQPVEEAEDIDGLGTVMPEEIARLLAGAVRQAITAEAVAMTASAATAALRGASNRLRLFPTYSEAERRAALLAALHFAHTGEEVGPGATVSGQIDRRWLVWLQECDTSTIEALGAAADWWLARKGEV